MFLRCGVALLLPAPLHMPALYCRCPPHAGHHCYCPCLPQVTTGSDVYSFGVLMWSLYTGQQPYVYKAGMFMPNTLFPRFPRSAHPEYKSLAESCLRRDPHERPSFVEIMNSMHKFFNIDDVPDHPPAGTPPRPSSPTLNLYEAAAAASATAPASATAAARACAPVRATATATPAASVATHPATACMPVSVADGSSSDEMLTGSVPYVFSHCVSRHALASVWDINTVHSQQLRSLDPVMSVLGSEDPLQCTQPSLSPLGTKASLLDSGVHARMLHVCDEQKQQQSVPSGVVQQWADSRDGVYTNTWIQTSSSVPPPTSVFLVVILGFLRVKLMSRHGQVDAPNFY